MTEHIIIAGAGGQGIMLLGKVIAEAAVIEGRHVTWLPAYGAEVRGGTANCTVIISDEEIGSPFVASADSAIIMNQPSFDFFKGRVSAGGIVVANNSLIQDPSAPRIQVVSLPLSDVALRLGNTRVANMVALGAFIARTVVLQAKPVQKALEKITPPDRPELLKLNLEAFVQGAALIDNRKRLSA